MTKKTGLSLKGNTQGLGSYTAVDELIHEEYRTQQALLEAQPTLVKRFLEGQARKLANSVHKEPDAGQFQPAGQSSSARYGRLQQSRCFRSPSRLNTASSGSAA